MEYVVWLIVQFLVGSVVFFLLSTLRLLLSLMCNSSLTSSPCLCFSFCSGGLRLKRDITEYGEFVRSFNAPTVDEKFELLGM